jgi:chlorophyllide a reductase subunit X
LPKAVGIPVLSTIPANDDIRRKSASYEIIGRPGSPWGPMFAELATTWHDRSPCAPQPHDTGPAAGPVRADVVGRDVVLEPATQFDMCGKTDIKPETLEVVYDEV